MSSSLRCWVAMTLLLGIGACRQGQLGLQAPGSMQRQQYNATLHDPYADNDAGPEVVGVALASFRSHWLSRCEGRAARQVVVPLDAALPGRLGGGWFGEYHSGCCLH